MLNEKKQNWCVQNDYIAKYVHVWPRTTKENKNTTADMIAWLQVNILLKKTLYYKIVWANNKIRRKIGFIMQIATDGFKDVLSYCKLCWLVDILWYMYVNGFSEIF